MKNPLLNVHKRQATEQAENAKALTLAQRAAQRLKNSSLDNVKKELELNDKIEESGVTALATLDTSHMEATPQRLSAHDQLVQAQERIESINGPEDFRSMADELDNMLATETGVSVVNIGVLRSYVQRLSVALHNNAEYESMLLDKDVHNILRVLRSMHQMDMSDYAEKQEKRVTRSTKKAISGKTDSKMKALASAMFDSLDLSAFKG